MFAYAQSVCPCAAAKRSPMASRMLQPVLMTPNVDSGEEGQSKLRRAMQVNAERRPVTAGVAPFCLGFCTAWLLL